MVISALGKIRQTGQLVITHQERCPWERGVSGHGVPDANRRPPDTFRGNLGGGVTGVSLGSGGSVGVQVAEGARFWSLPVCCHDFTFSSGEMGNFRKVLSDTTC